MIGTLWGLGLAAIAFFGVHLVPAVPGLRARLIATLTKNGYRGLFSLLAAAGIVWLVWAYIRAPYVELWPVMPWARLVPLAAMPLALILLVGAYAAPGEIKKIVRHPMLMGVLIWSLAHIPANGDAAGLILFGGFALYAALDMPLNDARIAREEPALWAERQRTTSTLPFVALLQGRAEPLNLGRLLPRAAAPGALVFLALLFLHEHIIGFTALP
ncbi:MAG: NnrU family protein [Alphaproteobacteria bacterium]